MSLLSFMRRHDEDRLVHQLRHAKTLQGTFASAAHVQLIYAMHACILIARSQQQQVHSALQDEYSLVKHVEMRFSHV